MLWSVLCLLFSLTVFFPMLSYVIESKEEGRGGHSNGEGDRGGSGEEPGLG